MAITILDALDPKQRDLYSRGIGQVGDLASGGMSDENTALVSQGRDALSQSLRGFDPAYIQDIYDKQSAPMRREFEERTLPGIRESMVSSGDFWSSGRGDLEAGARTGFQERMESMLANLSLQGRQQTERAIPQVEQVSGIEQRSAIDRMNAQMPWLNLPTRMAYGTSNTGGSGGRAGGSGYMSEREKAIAAGKTPMGESFVRRGYSNPW